MSEKCEELRNSLPENCVWVDLVTFHTCLAELDQYWQARYDAVVKENEELKRCRRIPSPYKSQCPKHKTDLACDEYGEEICIQCLAEKMATESLDKVTAELKRKVGE